MEKSLQLTVILPLVFFSLLQEFLQPLNLCLTVFNLLPMGQTDRQTDVDRQMDREASRQTDKSTDSSTLEHMYTCMDLPLCS